MLLVGAIVGVARRIRVTVGEEARKKNKFGRQGAAELSLHAQGAGAAGGRSRVAPA